jgi:V8-like Glu-specific endopeptidase
METRLTNRQIGELAKLLYDAFPRNRFSEVLQYRLNRRVDQFETPQDDYPSLLGRIVTTANSQLWWRDLVREARNVVPQDPGLLAFGTEFEMAPMAVTPAASGSQQLTDLQLERKIKDAQSTFDILMWRQRLGEIEGQVCRIEFPVKQAQGTGFLVGQNAVLTNYHVIEEIHKGNIQPSEVRLRFDYKVLGDGVAVAAGDLYRLDPDWLADWSPYSAEDKKSTPGDPREDELDYAILRVVGTPGDDPVGGKTNDPNPTPRRWIQAPAAAHNFAVQRALYIVQHPDGKPMQVAVDSEAVLNVNGNGTRVRYTTTTEPGSSGSPCFGPDWSWVALHHSGDPKYWMGERPTFNQGIPITAIQKLLKERKKESALGGKV